MTEKDYALYGTKVLNLKTQEIGLLICIWKNKFADAEIDYANLKMIFAKRTVEPTVKLVSLYLKWSVAK